LDGQKGLLSVISAQTLGSKTLSLNILPFQGTQINGDYLYLRNQNYDKFEVMGPGIIHLPLMEAARCWI